MPGPFLLEEIAKKSYFASEVQLYGWNHNCNYQSGKVKVPEQYLADWNLESIKKLKQKPVLNVGSKNFKNGYMVNVWWKQETATPTHNIWAIFILSELIHGRLFFSQEKGK